MSVLEGTSTIATDVLLPSNILRSLATIEADASSHVEAVLHGRLSKQTSTPLPTPPPTLTNDLNVETIALAKPQVGSGCFAMVLLQYGPPQEGLSTSQFCLFNGKKWAGWLIKNQI